MKMTEMVSTAPIAVEKSVRGDEIRVLTSCKAGKIVPVSYIPVLREDRVSRGRVRLALQMDETVHPLMNAVNVTAYAHFVPFLAFERFGGMETFNRSYQKIGEPHNDTPVPFFESVQFDRDAPFWKTLGIHWRASAINSAPLEAYNVLVNWRREARSARLPQRALLDTTLAEAFWKHPNLNHIVPDFDQAAMDGEVELQFASPKINVSGIGKHDTQGFTGVQSNVPVRERDAEGNYRNVVYERAIPTSTADSTFLRTTIANEYVPDIFAELESAGVKLSLANLELAKKTAAFAKLKDKFEAIDDDHIVDLMMEGIRVPDEALKQPILLDKKSTIFGMAERHAMDGASLDMSVTTGTTSLDLNFVTPAMNVGGVILITVEIVPEQLFERFYDEFLGLLDTDRLPNFLRDYLDPEKVDVVYNQYVDVEHSDRLGTFGYAPLNHAWKRSLTRIGGKYYRRLPDTFVEDRQRFWSIEQVDPALTDDFYLCPTDFPHSVFLDTLSDPFEVLALGGVQIVGNTVFGKGLDEDNNSYEEVMAQVDQSRIVQEEQL